MKTESHRESGRLYDKRRKGMPARLRQLAEVRQRRHVRVRVAVIELYGGCCAFCECDQFEFLTIDHINGDGKAHREEIGSRYRGIYDFLFRTEFRPDLYRILCANCHLALTKYGVEPGGEPLRPLSYWRAFGALRRAANRRAS
jgi:hypothetical protein